MPRIKVVPATPPGAYLARRIGVEPLYAAVRSVIGGSVRVDDAAAGLKVSHEALRMILRHVGAAAPLAELSAASRAECLRRLVHWRRQCKAWLRSRGTPDRGKEASRGH